MGIKLSKKQMKPILPLINLYEAGKKRVVRSVTKKDKEWLEIFY